MNTLIKPLIDMFAFNSMSVSVGLGDLGNEDAVRRWKNGEGSSISFLAGHLLATRYGVLKLIGASDENPYKDMFGGSASARDGGEYPDISELKAAWDELNPRFHAGLEAVTDDQVLTKVEGYPVDDNTVRGAIMFLAWHESYHVGQIGIFRTELGLPSAQSLIHEHLAAKSLALQLG